ncbi:MAG: pilus assembly PilX N-terminal domain-containing protein [Planctomycetota bacterium]
MAQARKSAHPKRVGTVLILSMIFVVIFSALAISMLALSSTNAQLASNQHKVDYALASAGSGLEVERYWLNRVMMPSTTPEASYLSTIVSLVKDDLTAEGITNITVSDSGAFAPVVLNSTNGQNFEGQLDIDANSPNTLHLQASGGAGQVSRTIGVSFDIDDYKWPIFNYGMATKGPINYTGNPTTLVASENWEADIYVESSGSAIAIDIEGNTNFQGDITIGNPAANADFGGDVQIAGESGQDAIDNHVTIGEDEYVEFPVPDTNQFEVFATGMVIDSSTDPNFFGDPNNPGTGNATLINAKIVAGTNPTFYCNALIQGILYIESPNVVIFSSNVLLQGIIVGDGDVTADPITDKIDFLGNFASGPYPPGSEFDAIREKEGTSIVAPGFAGTFQGNFSTVEGVVAFSGMKFSGNVAAIVKGTLINYSDDPLTVEGNPSMMFDRAGLTKIPAGFDTYKVLTYNPSSYQEF